MSVGRLGLLQRRARAPLLILLVTLWSHPALAQTDFMGVWRPLPRNQDGSGMVGDIAGVPVTDADRLRVQSWSPEDFDVTEWACRPHAWDYSLEGPLSALRFWADIDQATQKVIAYRGHLNQQEQETTIWMDGRPHPPENTLHTWSGFSTGEWDGDVLVVDTVGIKPSVPAYQNMPHSDQMRITERITLVTPDVLHNQVSIADPIVLEKPVTYTLAYRRMPNYKMVEFVCENNREYIDKKGVVHMKVRER